MPSGTAAACRCRGTTTPGVGFSPDGAAAPWLPFPAGWEGFAVSRQSRDGGSMLTLYRRALALRAAYSALGSGARR